MMDTLFCGHTTFGGPDIVARAIHSYIPAMEKALPGTQVKVNTDGDEVEIRVVSLRPGVYSYWKRFHGPVLTAGHLEHILLETLRQYVSEAFGRAVADFDRH